VNPNAADTAFDADVEAQLADLLARDQRYPRDAYLFVFAGLARTQETQVPDAGSGRDRHVGGGALLEALRDLALEEFGPMASRVLAAWSIRRTEDFGQLVFALIEAGLLSGTPTDSMADFVDGYDFATAFDEPFAETGDMPTDLPPIT
jgi:uncharacterized repeat protein (TIGR04138 family)